MKKIKITVLECESPTLRKESISFVTDELPYWKRLVLILWINWQILNTMYSYRTELNCWKLLCCKGCSIRSAFNPSDNSSVNQLFRNYQVYSPWFFWWLKGKELVKIKKKFKNKKSILSISSQQESQIFSRQLHVQS